MGGLSLFLPVLSEDAEWVQNHSITRIIDKSS